MRKLIIIILAVALCAIGARFGFTKYQKFTKEKAMKAAAIPKVTVATIGEGEVIKEYEAPARIVSKYQVNVIARISGYLTKSYFKEGDVVKEGQQLFTIEPEEWSLSASKAKSALANSKAQLDYYEKQLKRSEELVKLDYIAKSEYDNALAQRDAYKAQVAMQESAYRDSMRVYNYTNVKSPVNGRVGLINVTVGNYVNANSAPLTTIYSTDPMYVTFPIETKDYTDLVRIDGSDDVNRKVEFVFNNGMKYKLEGLQDFHDNKVDQATGTITMRATFSNPDGALIHGDFGKVILYATKKDKVPVVPKSATMENQEGKYVYVLDENNLPKMSYIKTNGQTDNGEWIVSEGVNTGDTLVTSGIQRVIPGNPVKIVEQEVKDATENQPQENLKNKEEVLNKEVK